MTRRSTVAVAWVRLLLLLLRCLVRLLITTMVFFVNTLPESRSQRASPIRLYRMDQSVGQSDMCICVPENGVLVQSCIGDLKEAVFNRNGLGL